MAAKKKDWNELLGSSTGGSADTAVAEDGPKEPPATVLMHTIVGNPENPRDEDDYSDADPEFVELKHSMKEIGQLQPLAVISRPAYERTKPGHDKALGDAEWVVVTGNRRLAAARQLGWTRIDVKVQDRLGDGDGSKIDEAVIIENIHRKNIAPIKEAEFLQRMVERLGSQDKAAARIGKSQMYVSHRLALLQLAPDVQKEVDAGAVKLKDVRTITRKPHEEQRVAVAQLKQKAAAPKPPKQTVAAPVQNPVLKPAPEPVVVPEPAGVQNPVLNEPEVTESDVVVRGLEVPDPRTSSPAAPVERNGTPPDHILPAVGWEKLSELLVEQLSELDRHRLTRKLERIMAAEFRGTDAPEPSTS
jgi:ParB family chromosome partitioning protein